MTLLIKNVVVMIILVATLSSCNQGTSLQTYFVNNQEQPNFLSVDLPTSMLNIDQTSLTDAQKEAYKSIQKLNVLAYKIDTTNATAYKTELAKVKTILNDPKYEELMRGGNTADGKFMIKFLGKDDDIDELILFGNANDKGFAIVRVLGNHMNANKIMTLTSALDSADLDSSQLNQFAEFFK